MNHRSVGAVKPDGGVYVFTDLDDFPFKLLVLILEKFAGTFRSDFGVGCEQAEREGGYEGENEDR